MPRGLIELTESSPTHVYALLQGEDTDLDQLKETHMTVCGGCQMQSFCHLLLWSQDALLSWRQRVTMPMECRQPEMFLTASEFRDF